jgi:ribosomal protein S8
LHSIFLSLSTFEAIKIQVIFFSGCSGYISEFEYVVDHREGKIVVEFNGRLNKSVVISPRFDVGVKDIEPWTARLLPSRQVNKSFP